MPIIISFVNKKCQFLKTEKYSYACGSEYGIMWGIPGKVSVWVNGEIVLFLKVENLCYVE